MHCLAGRKFRVRGRFQNIFVTQVIIIAAIEVIFISTHERYMRSVPLFDILSSSMLMLKSSCLVWNVWFSTKKSGDWQLAPWLEDEALTSFAESSLLAPPELLSARRRLSRLIMKSSIKLEVLSRYPLRTSSKSKTSASWSSPSAENYPFGIDCGWSARDMLAATCGISIWEACAASAHHPRPSKTTLHQHPDKVIAYFLISSSCE